jgi:NADP-dependent 3-hydroxy acid dehydrogenase YdfG
MIIREVRGAEQHSKRTRHFKIDEWNWMIDVNIRGVLHGIDAVLPRMEAQGHGAISSTFPQLAGSSFSRPSPSTRPPSSRCERSLKACGRSEQNSLYRCTCVYPGVVESELADTIRDETARERMKAYRKMAIQPDAIGPRHPIRATERHGRERDRRAPARHAGLTGPPSIGKLKAGQLLNV